MMNEAFLQSIWKYKLFNQHHFTGTGNETIELVSTGELNQDSGPDFFNAKIKIDGVLLAGNVELHVKTSDWLKHNHTKDKAYDNIILHVVYEHDTEIAQNKEHSVAVLELKSYIKKETIAQYEELQLSKKEIACGKSITSVEPLIWTSWLQRLAISRMENKTTYIEHLFEYCAHDYEETLYVLLCRYFGFRVNNEAFELLAKSLPYAIIKKYKDNHVTIEALLFGTAGLLQDVFEDVYPRLLQNEFEFYRHKHQLIPLKKEIWKFARTRPVNFPTIRISQLATLFGKQQSLFHLIEQKSEIKVLREYFNSSTSEYWNTHFKFDSDVSGSEKQLGADAFELIVINVIIPFLFFYARTSGKEIYTDYAIDTLSALLPEKNVKTKMYTSLGIKAQNALETQALIHLHDNFCSAKMCLHCNVAQYLLKKV